MNLNLEKNLMKNYFTFCWPLKKAWYNFHLLKLNLFLMDFVVCFMLLFVYIGETSPVHHTIYLVSPKNGSYTNQNNDTLQFVYNHTGSLTGIVNCTLYLDGNPVNYSTDVPANTNWIVYSNQSWDEGTHYWYVNCTNGTSQESSLDIGQNYTFIADFTQPNIILIYPPNGTTLPGGKFSIWVNISTDENAICRYSTNPSFNYSDGTIFNNTGAMNHSFSQIIINGQTYKFYYKCNDTAGNINNESTLHSFSIGPAIVSIQNVSIKPGENTTIPIMIYNVIGVKGATINLTYNASVVHVIDFGNSDFNFEVYSDVNNTAGYFLYAIANVPTGLTGDITFIEVTLKAVGNTGDQSPLNLAVLSLNDGTGPDSIPRTAENGTFTILDTTPPTITLVYPPNGSSLPAGTTWTWINISTDENATCRYNLTSPTFNYTTDGLNFTNTGVLTHSFNYSGLLNGKSYHLYYKCKDSVGNINNKSTTHIFKVNSLPFTPNITGPKIGSVGESLKFTASSSDPDGDSIHLSFVFLGTDNKEHLACIHYNSAGHCSYSWNEAGDYYVKVKATDNNGESSNWAKRNITITTTPIIIDYFPTGREVPLNSNISVTFNVAMNKTSVQKAFSISPQVTGSFSWKDNKMVFEPDSNLSETTYTVNITTEAKNLAGTSFESPFSWSFTTASPPLKFEYDPIKDNNMKAIIAESWSEMSYSTLKETLIEQGFEVVYFGASADLQNVEDSLKDNNTKIFLETAHGSDNYFIFENPIRYFYAEKNLLYPNLRTALQNRNSLTIGIYESCGEALFQTGHWAYESLKGDICSGSVVRHFSQGNPEPVYCSNPADQLPSPSGPKYYWKFFKKLGEGDTLYQAFPYNFESGNRIIFGEPNLRYPQFCGDVNYNNVVNLIDVQVLKDYLNGTGKIHSEWDADINGDGKIDATDVFYLERHINKLGVAPHPRPRGWHITPVQAYDYNGEKGIQRDEVKQAELDWRNGYLSYADYMRVAAAAPALSEKSNENGGGGGGGYTPTSNKITVENKGAIIKIEINLNKSVISPSLKVEQISTIPIQKPKGTVYQYFNITKRNFNNSIIKNATIEFKVNNSWIKENEIKNIYLAKYENGWIKLKTELINKTENYTYYRSETDSFSYFAIIGEKEILICEEGKKRCSNNNLEQCINNSWKLIETCNYGCNETALKCNPKPTEKICEEGAKRCVDNNLQKCENGEWKTIETCDYGCNSTSLTCNPAPAEKPEKRNYLIYILILLAIIGGVLSYLYRDRIKDFLKKIRTERMLKTELRERIENQKTETKSEKSELGEIEEKIREVEEKIREMRKNGKDTSEIEKELKIAKEDIDFGLHVLAKYRINRILEKLKEY